MVMPSVGIITAMATELWPLIRDWPVSVGEYDSRRYRFFEKEPAVVLCGGIGREPGRRAAEAVIARANPALLIAAGLAGGLRPEWTVGRTMVAAAVVDAATGRRYATQFGEGTVVSSPTISGLEEKRELAQRYHADLVDMEGAAVGEVAQAHGLPFLAVKAVSDEHSFQLPPLEPFVDAEGRFQGGRFAVYAALHPGWWPTLVRLKRNSDRAAAALARLLQELIRQHAGEGEGAERAEMIRR